MPAAGSTGRSGRGTIHPLVRAEPFLPEETSCSNPRLSTTWHNPNSPTFGQVPSIFVSFVITTARLAPDQAAVDTIVPTVDTWSGPSLRRRDCAANGTSLCQAVGEREETVREIDPDAAPGLSGTARGSRPSR